MSDIKIIHIHNKPTSAEKEILLNCNCEDKIWYMDTFIMKYYNKAKRQGWKQTVEYIYDDGTVCGGRFEAPERSVTIRNTEKKQMSEKQLTNLNNIDDD